MSVAQEITATRHGMAYARRWIGTNCVLGKTLCVPIWLLWREYRAYCKRLGLQADACDLRAVLELAEWARVIERPNARGRFKTLVEGVGLRPTASTTGSLK